VSDPRWKGSAGAALSAQVIDRLKRGKPLDDLRLGSSGHRVNLAGLLASPSHRVEVRRVGSIEIERVDGIVEIAGRSLFRLDLSGARLNGWRLRKCEIVDCRFDEARCADWILWHCTVRDCSFSAADLRGAMLGTFPEGGRVKWERVSFAEADLRGASAYGAVFVDCDFSNARLEETNFLQCDFVRCRFAGVMEEVLFDGRRVPDRPVAAEMESVDFANAHFVNVDFRGYSLRNTELPRDPDVFPIHRFPCVGRRVVAALSGASGPSERVVRGMIENSMPWTEDRPDSVWVFNRRDWREWGGDDAAILAERLMKQAETECAS